MRNWKILMLAALAGVVYSAFHLYPSDAPSMREETVAEIVAEAVPEKPSAVEPVREVRAPDAAPARPHEEDPEDRADPVAKAQRDYEERNVRELRNPGILPE